ncbi:Protein kinase domain [Trypanosoma vivax]|nr:Protein kinase domain [Trypanosoma vivax]
MRYVLDDEDDCDEEKDITSCASTSTASYVAESGHQRSDPNAYSEENDRSLQERYVWSNTEYMDDDDDSDDSSARNEYEDDESAIMDDLQSPMQVVGDYYTLYIQMELCSQQSLRNLIDQCEKDGESFFFSAEGDRIATSILRQLLTVVVHFHRQKIVHRDLKPDNILFEQNCMAGGEVGTIRVADFGLARTLQCPARHNLNDVYPDAGLLQGDVTPKMFHTGGLGSVLYCAPEQEQGEQYGFSVDEYSVGMIALEMWLAVDKQGFRERFNIMTSVSKGEPLPQWFCTKYPRIAEVISGLIERDPGARRSCEEILNEADLPGDSADVVEALGTIRRHGERLSGRVLHCLKQVIMEQSHTHVLVAKETLKAPLSTVMFELVQAANVIGMLHGAIFVPHCDSLIPMNGTLSEMDVPWTIDMCSRVWAMPTQPHLATGHFLSAHSDQHIGSFYSFYYRTRPYAVFATPLCSSGIEGETFLDPLLALLHLISVSELRCKLDIVISHADWMSALHSNAGCAMEYIDRINHASCTIETNESIGPVLQKVSAALKEQNLLSLSPEQFEIVRSFISRLVEVLPLFGKVASNVRVCVDPALRPSETSVNKSFIKHGVFFECRTRDGGQPVAFLCNLENFTNRCGARAANFPLACLNVDLHELGSICDRVRFPQNDLVLFRGVAVRPKEMKSLAHIRSALAVTANLWADNMRACLRVNHDAHKLGKPVKAMGRQMLVHVGHQSATVSFFREAKLRNQPVDITISDVCKTVRRYCSVDQADDLILYFGECENRVHSEEVRRVFSLIKRSLPRVLVVDADVKKIEECIRQFTGESSPLHTCTAATNVNPDGEHLVIPELVEWMKTKVTTYGIVPIFSARDRVLTFAIDQKQLRVARFFDTKQCKPSSRGDNTKRRK